MTVERILKHIEKYLKEDKTLDFDNIPSNIEIHILPTMGDPTQPQDKVSLIIFEKVKNGMIPRFQVTVENFLKNNLYEPH